MKLANTGLAILSLLLGIFIIVYSKVKPSLSFNFGLVIGILLMTNGGLRLWLYYFRRNKSKKGTGER